MGKDESFDQHDKMASHFSHMHALSAFFREAGALGWSHIPRQIELQLTKGATQAYNYNA